MLYWISLEQGGYLKVINVTTLTMVAMVKFSGTVVDFRPIDC